MQLSLDVQLDPADQSTDPTSGQTHRQTVRLERYWHWVIGYWHGRRIFDVWGQQHDMFLASSYMGACGEAAEGGGRADGTGGGQLPLTMTFSP